MFVELFCKSNFSFLRGASDSREYMDQACQLEMDALGIMDVNGVYALPRAYEYQKKSKRPIKLISGAELKVEDHHPISLIAQTRRAYGLMCRLITTAHAGKEKGAAYITLLEISTAFDEYKDASAELIACVPASASCNFTLLKVLFPNRLYIKLCHYQDGLDEGRFAACKELAQLQMLPIVATNDVHYHAQHRSQLQDCLTCVRESTSLRKAGFHLFGNNERYLKSNRQMRALFESLPEAIENTWKIAGSCTFNLSELKYTYPSEFIPEGYSSQSYLEECVFQKAKILYHGYIPAAVDHQICHELKLIRKLNYADYFLTIYDIVQFAIREDILCQGRGSAANSVICYILGITSVDPVESHLLFERFLSEEQASPPDIDVDFEHERREEVIQFIYKRYGRDRAAMVSAVRTYQRKSSFIELSKSIGIDCGTMSYDVLSRDFDKIAQSDKDKRPVIDGMVETLRDFPRHLSIHSGGFVLSETPLIEIVPIEPARMEDRTIVQWDKHDLEILGLMKVDILALGFLTAMNKISKTTGRSWRDVPANDEATFQMIREAKTDGTFQIESRAQKAMLVRTLPTTFYDLVVQVAIVRPGPNVGNMVKPYIQRRENSRRGVHYKLPTDDMIPILGRTYGVPIFQEQIMKLAITKASFTAGEADELRRALAKWRSAEGVSKMGEKLYKGLRGGGVPKEYADELFNYVRGYAHYGFPESHAASFASIAYKSAYYKRHYPAEFLCGLINSQPMGFYSIDTLINEAKRENVIVHPIHPQLSDWDALYLGNKEVRMGFRNLRKIRREQVEHMKRVRAERSFHSLKDFISRTQFSRDVIEVMAIGDVFACFGMDQRDTFWSSVEFTNLFATETNDQLSLFTMPEPRISLVYRHGKKSAEENLPLFDSMSLLETIVADYKSTGYSLRGNIMKGIRLEKPDLPDTTSVDLKRMHKNDVGTFAGVLSVIQRPPTAKGVAFLTLEDEFGSMDFICHKETFENFLHVIQASRFLLIKGKIQQNGTGRSVLVSDIKNFAQSTGAKPMTAGEHSRPLRAEDL